MDMSPEGEFVHLEWRFMPSYDGGGGGQEQTRQLEVSRYIYPASWLPSNFNLNTVRF